VVLPRLTRSPSETTGTYIKTPIKDTTEKRASPQPSVVEQILTQTTLTPYTMDGQVQGIQIKGLDTIPLAGLLGLKDGDIIHVVNGQTLTSKQKAFQILKKAKSQRMLDIELLRDGQTKSLSFPIR
jgi:type II secretory pathway component PulC